MSIFYFIVVVSFLYDLAFYLGIRNTARFPHPFVYFRSLGDVEYLRGFAVMLRQVMFSLVAGGLLGWAIGFAISKSGWLSRATICFLRIAMWFPFFVIFAIPGTFALSIAATMLASVHYYLTARLLLESSKGEAFRYAVGEIALRTLLFQLIAQIWDQRWQWTMFPMNLDCKIGLAVFGLILAVVFSTTWFVRMNFSAGCDRRRTIQSKEIDCLRTISRWGVALLTVIWLLLWELYTLALQADYISPVVAGQKMLLFLVTGEFWKYIFTSLFEIAGGLVLGALLAFLALSVMHRSEAMRHVIHKILPLTHLSPVALWLLVFCVIGSVQSEWFRIIVPGVGHKVIAVGFLTFFPLVQALWAFRDTALFQRWSIAKSASE